MRIFDIDRDTSCKMYNTKPEFEDIRFLIIPVAEWKRLLYRVSISDWTDTNKKDNDTLLYKL